MSLISGSGISSSAHVGLAGVSSPPAPVLIKCRGCVRAWPRRVCVSPGISKGCLLTSPVSLLLSPRSHFPWSPRVGLHSRMSPSPVLLGAPPTPPPRRRLPAEGPALAPLWAPRQMPPFRFLSSRPDPSRLCAVRLACSQKAPETRFWPHLAAPGQSITRSVQVGERPGGGLNWF